MKHDLEAINAALVLGDEVCPPPGTVLSGDFGSIWKIISGVYGDEGGVLAVDVLVEGNTEPFNISMVVPRADMVIASIPEDAPPFSEWVRAVS